MIQYLMELSNEYIGDRIRQARKDRNRTQSDLAEALGKTTGAISQLEQGNVQISVIELAKIADYLNKPIEYFFGEEYLGNDVQTIVAVIRKMPPCKIRLMPHSDSGVRRTVIPEHAAQ